MTPDIDFKYEAVVQCDVSVLKIHSAKQSQINFDLNTYVLFLGTVLCMVLVSEEVET